ncbi:MULTISPECIES: Flp pilus assembly protein CpaB [unclassified Bordetella]|uniref:Flp pilus assembly protein CpaB n=1 Tax=unclassified Bordetella TaxID=2630031 RepID=UPI0013289CCE|nr:MULTISPECIES: Flp pilus assembly protein CpaB [unclassified Bordetella]MVW72113.1 Flp pilus assembly protein CpaB [Bordetella sp. 15P40C-2]MVW78830.1 Flp pilus assembly protein CpaB [Bordetella sp. 02P26C-1]
MTSLHSPLPVRLRKLGVYGVSLVAGLSAAWAVHEHIQSREAELARQAQVPTQERVVVAVDLPAGKPLGIDDLALREVPLAWLPAHSFGAEAVDEVLGRKLATDLKQGEILQPTHIAATEQPAPSERVQPGRRALALTVGEIDAATGVLRTGDLIDLFVSFAHHGQRITSPLATGVRVLAMENGPDPRALITLDVSEKDAIKLVAARQAGRMTAVLRHRQDAVVAGNAEPKDLAAWMGLERPHEVQRRHVPVLYGDRVDSQNWVFESGSEGTGGRPASSGAGGRSTPAGDASKQEK